MIRGLIVAFFVLTALPGSLRAQGPDSLALDLSLGVSAGSSNRGNYYHPGAAAIEFTLAYGPRHETGRVTALALGGTISFSATDICAINDAEPGVCKTLFPSTIHLGLITGFQAGRPNAQLRAMAGPVLFSGDGNSGAGGHLQIDGAAGLTHVALLGIFHTQLLRRSDGETLFLRSVGIGVRVQ
jgi:hypothetical protein